MNTRSKKVPSGIQAIRMAVLILFSYNLEINKMLRLKVVEYFDSVINEIDLFTEKKIQSDETEPGEDWWNKRRQDQIDQVREMERTCLSHVNSLNKWKEIESEEWMKRVFIEYCFTMEWSGLLFLVKANRYVEPKEKQFLRMKVDWVDFLSGRFKTRILISDEKSLVITFHDLDSALQDQFLSESSTIDISSWLTNYKLVTKADCWQNLKYEDKSPIQFDDGLQVQNFKFTYSMNDSQQEKEAIEFVKCLKAHHPHHIENITVSFIYNETRPNLTIECLQSLNFCKRIDMCLFTGLTSGQKKGSQVDEVSKYTDWSSLKYWKPIERIDYSELSILETTKIVDFDQFALTLIDLQVPENADYSSLGTSLECLYVSPDHKDIVIPCELISSFANLNKLSLSLNETMLTTDHLIDLPMLEELKLSLYDSEIVKTTKTKLRFKVPKLTSLHLSFVCKLEDWSSLLSGFSHVKKLRIYSKDDQVVRKGWFRGFDNVYELSLNLCEGPIDSQLFIGFENLAYLELYYGPENRLDRRALHKLTKLKIISFIDSFKDDLNAPQETQDKRLFDGLYSLQSIHHGRYFNHLQSLVYFENLGRHIMVIYCLHFNFFY